MRVRGRSINTKSGIMREKMSDNMREKMREKMINISIE